jgi:L-threonylcarbamoyladenylate synthase
METKILPASEEAIQEAAQLLREGQLVGIPTETVYGLGANAFDEAAVRSIFAAKGRPADNPLIVHVSRPEEAEPLCEVTETARTLMKAFCPGPLTMLMKRKSCISDVVTAGLPLSAFLPILWHTGCWKCAVFLLPLPAPTPAANPAPPRPSM